MIKRKFLDEISAIRYAYNNYIEEELYGEFILSDRALEIQLNDGNLDYEYKNNYKTDSNMKRLEKTIGNYDFCYFLVDFIRGNDDEMVAKVFFEVIETLLIEDLDDDGAVHTGLLEVLIQTKDDILKYNKFLKHETKLCLKNIFRAYGEYNLIPYLKLPKKQSILNKILNRFSLKK